MGGRGSTSASAQAESDRELLREAFVRERDRARGGQSVMARDIEAVMDAGVGLLDSGRGRELVYDRDFAALRHVMAETYTANGQTSVMGNMRNLSGDGGNMPMYLERDEWDAARAAFREAMAKVTAKGYTEEEVAAGVALYRHLRRRL